MRSGSTHRCQFLWLCDLSSSRRLVGQLIFPNDPLASSERSLGGMLSLAAGKTLGIPRKGLDSQRPRQEYEGVALVHQHSAQEPLFQTAIAALSLRHAKRSSKSAPQI